MWKVVSFKLFSFLLLINKFLAVTLLQKSFTSYFEWWSKIFLGWADSFYFLCLAIWMLFFNDFGCSELILRKIWWSSFFGNVLLCNLLFLLSISISTKEIFSFDILYLNVIYGYFVFNCFRNVSRSVLLPVLTKNILSINLRYMKEWNSVDNAVYKFISKWSRYNW